MHHAALYSPADVHSTSPTANAAPNIKTPSPPLPPPTRTQTFTVLVDGNDKPLWSKPLPSSDAVSGADAHDEDGANGGGSQQLFKQLSVGASELDAVTPLPCCPVRDSESNQLQLGLTVQVTGVQPLQSAVALRARTAGGADASAASAADADSCIAKALIGATLTVRVAHDLGVSAQLTVVLRQSGEAA
jgi:hypothetical protein